jgi:hypothetical protein
MAPTKAVPIPCLQEGTEKEQKMSKRVGKREEGREKKPLREGQYHKVASQS